MGGEEKNVYISVETINGRMFKTDQAVNRSGCGSPFRVNSITVTLPNGK